MRPRNGPLYSRFAPVPGTATGCFASDVGRPLDAFKRWAVDDALPLWSGRGFDADAGLFEEQLSFDGSPVTTVPRRVMVQARQICVYALATRHSWHDGLRVAVAAGHSLIERFWAKDKIGGWVFSIDRNGQVADDRRDLYANAFVLFALANLIELTGDRRFVDAVGETLAVLDRHFADPRGGGFWDALPRSDSLRRQNPHMHLLEAYIALHDATANDAYLDRAEQLVALAKRKFIDRRTGALREYFDDAWHVSPSAGQGCVEPGHLFEWAWLLRRYEKKTDVSMNFLVQPLIAAALRHGTNRHTGRIIDEVCEDGRVCRRSSRSWPHAEALKCMAMEYQLGHADYRTEAAAILTRLREAYCPDYLAGGWIDHLAEDDSPISRVMPASTLYHLTYALSECERCFRDEAGHRLRRFVPSESGMSHAVALIPHAASLRKTPLQNAISPAAPIARSRKTAQPRV